MTWWRRFVRLWRRSWPPTWSCMSATARTQTAPKQRADVLRVLVELGLEDRLQSGVIEALNKIDLLDQRQRACLAEQGRGGVNGADGHPGHASVVAASALTGSGIEDLIGEIDARLTATRRVVEVRVSYADGATLAWIYRHGEVLEQSDDDGEARLRVGLSPANAGRLEQRPGVSLTID